MHTDGQLVTLPLPDEEASSSFEDEVDAEEAAEALVVVDAVHSPSPANVMVASGLSHCARVSMHLLEYVLPSDPQTGLYSSVQASGHSDVVDVLADEAASDALAPHSPSLAIVNACLLLQSAIEKTQLLE